MRFVVLQSSKSKAEGEIDIKTLLEPYQDRIKILDSTKDIALVEAEESDLKGITMTDQRIGYTLETSFPLPDTRKRIRDTIY